MYKRYDESDAFYAGEDNILRNIPNSIESCKLVLEPELKKKLLSESAINNSVNVITNMGVNEANTPYLSDDRVNFNDSMSVGSENSFSGSGNAMEKGNVRVRTMDSSIRNGYVQNRTEQVTTTSYNNYSGGYADSNPYEDNSRFFGNSGISQTLILLFVVVLVVLVFVVSLIVIKYIGV